MNRLNCIRLERHAAALTGNCEAGTETHLQLSGVHSGGRVDRERTRAG